MLKTTDYDCLKTHFIRPADDALTHCEHKRSCPGLSDEQWLQMGIERSIKECRTGRGFLQDSQIEDLEDLSKVDVYAGDGHYHKTSTHERLIKKAPSGRALLHRTYAPMH